MKKIIFILFLLNCSIGYGQFTNEQIKGTFAGKKWAIVKYEIFGVADEPKPEQANDYIQLNADMTFEVMEKGITYKGTWTSMNPNAYFTCKATGGKWTKTFKFITIGEAESVIQYKDPDLIKTDYYLVVK